MPDDTTVPFGFPAVGRKTLVAAFDGGRITSDGGVLLLGVVERQLGIAQRLARLIADPRNPACVTHSVDTILRARILAIACGYEDADDLDHLRTDPAFKLACGRLPDRGVPDGALRRGVCPWADGGDTRRGHGDQGCPALDLPAGSVGSA